MLRALNRIDQISQMTRIYHWFTWTLKLTRSFLTIYKLFPWFSV